MTTLDIARLSPQERLDLIAALARRMATFDADKQDAVAWETIEAQFDRRAP